MLSQQQVDQFHRNGYLRGSTVLTDDTVELLRREMQRVIDDRDNRSVPQPFMVCDIGRIEQPVWQVVNIWQASKPFEALIHNRQIVEEVAQLTDAKAVRIWHDQVVYKPASKGGAVYWHQDAPLWPVLAPMTEVSAWVAMDDVDEENGCMRMVPGSHLWGNQIEFLQTLKTVQDMPSEFQGRPIELQQCPVKKGEVHYHHALTWHASPANASARSRRAIALCYMTDETRFVASGEHVIKPLIEVRDGEYLQGKHFPVVWEVGATQSAD